MASSQPLESNSSASSMTVNLLACQCINSMKSNLVSVLEAAERQEIVVLHKVHEASWSGNQDVTAHLELLALIPSGSTSIHNARAQHCTVAQATSQVERLSSELAGRTHNQYQRLGTDPVCKRVVAGWVGSRCRQLASFTHEL